MPSHIYMVQRNTNTSERLNIFPSHNHIHYKGSLNVVRLNFWKLLMQVHEIATSPFLLLLFFLIFLFFWVCSVDDKPGLNKMVMDMLERRLQEDQAK